MQTGIRSALFVDFDNIHICLRTDHGAPVAETFATHPRAWIRWLIRLGAPQADETAMRRIILRKCYLNPVRYWRYRIDFTRAGCEVVDCPSLTQQGKSSSDINMVLDMSDALAQEDPSFDEFIIFSGDADFTPILLRLRQRGRRIVIITPSMSSPAYKAVADQVVDTDQLVDEALLSPSGPASPGQRPPDPEVSREADPEEESDAPIEEVLEFIRQTLAEAPEAISGSGLAQRIRDRFGSIGNWFGHSSFGSFLDARLPDLDLRYVVQSTKNFVYDPRRHSLPEAADPPAHRIQPDEDLFPLSSRLRNNTGLPSLNKAAYAHLFATLAREVRQNPGEYSLSATSRILRDRIADSPYPVSRSHISWILRCIHLDPDELARKKRILTRDLTRKFLDNVLSLVESDGMDLSDEENRLLKGWLDPAPRTRKKAARKQAGKVEKDG